MNGLKKSPRSGSGRIFQSSAGFSVAYEIVRAIAAPTPRCGSLRTCGSAALSVCYVAAGWWDAYWHLSLQPWDAAGGALIVCEAGGQVTDLSGARWRPTTGPCLASNGLIHPPFLRLLHRPLT